MRCARHCGVGAAATVTAHWSALHHFQQSLTRDVGVHQNSHSDVVRSRGRHRATAPPPPVSQQRSLQSLPHSQRSVQHCTHNAHVTERLHSGVIQRTPQHVRRKGAKLEQLGADNTHLTSYPYQSHICDNRFSCFLLPGFANRTITSINGCEVTIYIQIFLKINNFLGGFPENWARKCPSGSKRSFD